MKNNYDVVVIGGSLGGIMAAYSSLKQGLNVLLVEETDWIGGQLTSQGVPSDEHDFIETTGSTTTYRNFREKVRDYYRNHPNVIEEIKKTKIFNPGSGWVSRNAHEPLLALKLFNEMLEPFVENGKLTILLETVVTSAKYDDEFVESLTLLTNNQVREVFATYFVDGTDNGDLLPITKTDYVTGAESFDEYNEPHAPKETKPHDMQPVTWVIAVEWEEGGNNRIEKPAMYEFYKNYQMPFNEPILSWYAAGLDMGTKRQFSLFATPHTKFENTPAMFTYRQVFNPNIFKDKKGLNPITLINWPQNDYIMGNIIENDNVEFHKYAAKQLSLSLVYWLQTEAERDDGKGFGYPEIKISKGTLGTDDGLAKAPYIRESRRIKALYTIREQDISKKHAKKIPEYWDSIGIGLYHIDLHMTTETKTYFFDETWPFEIPLGALIPRNRKNLIAACKNIGTTHITNGCYRLHPIEWNIGESAGHAVSYAIKNKVDLHELYENKTHVKNLQDILVENGVQLKWPDEIVKGGK